MKRSASVTELAEFVHRRGDLYPPLHGRTRAEEGIDAQRRLQRNRPSSYLREHPVSATFAVEGLTLELSGRVDGFDAERGEVEEIKTTRAEAALAERYLGSAHWAQLKLYAALICRESSAASLDVVLTYCHPDTLAAQSWRETLTRSALEVFLEDTVAAYARWRLEQQAYAHRRNAWLKARAFPYSSYRQHQRAMARRVYRAFRDGEHLLLEAPTGSGKTLGVLYPALKALAEGHVDRLFYSTSRGTGAIAARNACQSLADAAGQLRFVELVAKEKACALPGTPCSSEHCPYAAGYYDRRGAAVTELLDRAAMDSAAVRQVAEQHQVCPFELSLDAALWADVIVGDYNYLLDPVVRLQRFADDDRLGPLIDEAHQLADRARAMLSLGLERGEVRRALAEAPPGGLLPRLRGLDRQLVALRRTETLGPEQRIATPAALLRAVQRLLDTLSDEAIELDAYPATRELVFSLSRWARSESWVEEGAFAWFGAASGRGRRGEITIKLSCLDAGPYLARTLRGYGPHVRFSGTVTPLDLYQRLHGLHDAPAERLASLFRPAQLGLFIVPDLSVLYRHRARTLPALAELVSSATSAAAGNYLVALPSFEYLDALSAALAGNDVSVLAQTPGMDTAAREAFIARFADASNLVGLVVLGGVFAESVDFSRARLKGVICVGLGLPPADPVRDSVAAWFAELGAAPGAAAEAGVTNDGAADNEPVETAAGLPAADRLGEAVAYQQPAMSKVLQMAGRLLRGPRDRGVVCLVDGRFRLPAYQRFFPSHWQPAVVQRGALPAALAEFWQGAEGSVQAPRWRTGRSSERAG